jgi:5-methylcytosine-specific restriction endonuclease McrA
MFLDKHNVRQEFRLAVFQRDGYKCRICGSTHLLDAHHITNRNEMEDGGYVVENGITLCDRCHLVAERFYPDKLYQLIGSPLTFRKANQPGC